LTEQSGGKVLQVLKGIEAKTRLPLLIALAIGQGIIEAQLGIGERGHKYWNIFTVGGLENAALLLPLRQMRSDGAVQLVRAHHFIRIPAAKYGCHHTLHVVEVLLRFERVVDAVVSSLVEFLVAELGIMTEMRAPGRFDQAVRHQRSGGNDGVDNAAIDQL